MTVTPPPNLNQGSLNVPGFPFAIAKPFNNITPFTYRDGNTWAEAQEDFRDWIINSLIGFVDSRGDNIITEYNKAVVTLSQVIDKLGVDRGAFEQFTNDAKSSFTTIRNEAVATTSGIRDTAIAARTGAELARDLAKAYATTVTGVSAMTESQVLVGKIPESPMTIPPAQPHYGKAQGGSVAVVATVSGATAGGSGYVTGDTITVAGGTYTKPAIFRVQANGGGVTSLTLVQSGLYTANPVNPVAQASTSGNGVGAQLNVTFSASGSAFAETTFVDVAPDSTTKILYTGYGPVNVNSTGGWGSNGGDASEWTWETDATFIELFFLSFNSQYQLWVDGQRVSLTPRSSDASGASLTWELDLGDVEKRVRQFRLFCSNALLTRIRYGKADTGTFRKPIVTKRLALGYGDSYMQGSGASETSMTAFRTMCELLGLDSHPDGVGGAGWINSTSGSATSRITTNAPKLSRTPAFIFLDLGYNDYGSDLNAVGAAMDTAIAAAKAAYPTAKIIGFGPATPLGETPQLQNLKVKMQERYNAVGVPMIDVANWVNADNKSRYTGTDQVHPTALGHAYIGALKAQAVRSLNVL